MHTASLSPSTFSTTVMSPLALNEKHAPDADIEFNDHTGIVDALYRFGAGQDTHDTALFASAFAHDAALDFTQPAGRLGREMPVLQGRDRIVQTIMPSIASLDTTHTVTNVRVAVQDERATAWALVEAQHLPKENHASWLLLKNIYSVALLKEDGVWRIVHLRIDNVWFQGDPAVLFPG